MAKEPDYKQILVNLIASSCLADHLGDIYEDMDEAAIQAGIFTKAESREFEDSNDRTTFLVKKYKAETVNGTKFSEDEDE